MQSDPSYGPWSDASSINEPLRERALAFREGAEEGKEENEERLIVIPSPPSLKCAKEGCARRGERGGFECGEGKRKHTVGLEPTISCSVGKRLIQLGYACLFDCFREDYTAAGTRSEEEGTKRF